MRHIHGHCSEDGGGLGRERESQTGGRGVNVRVEWAKGEASSVLCRHNLECSAIDISAGEQAVLRKAGNDAL